jgi:hypothetical protein
MTVICYPSVGKKKALKLSCAFAEGCGGEIAGTGETKLRPGAAFFYGWTEHTVPLIEQCKGQGREWYYADNAYYFGRGKFFRVTRGALMHDGAGSAKPARFERFGLEIRDWQRDGGHVVVATQSELFYRQRLGITRDAWVERVIGNLARHTSRPVVVCHKAPPAREVRLPHLNFEEALPGAWAVVSHSSSVMVKALIEGIPIFSLARSMATSMGSNDLAQIETPLFPDGREQWLWNLAANQWTYGEIAAGLAWRYLRSSPLPAFVSPVAARPHGSAVA